MTDAPKPHNLVIEVIEDDDGWFEEQQDKRRRAITIHMPWHTEFRNGK